MASLASVLPAPKRGAGSGGQGGASDEESADEFDAALESAYSGTASGIRDIVTHTSERGAGQDPVAAALLRQGARSDKVIHADARALIEVGRSNEEALERPSEEEVAATTLETRKALDAIVTGKTTGMTVKTQAQTSKPTYVDYTPSQQGPAWNSGASKRVIRMVDVAKDPLEPSRFKRKNAVPRGGGSPPVPVLHSPTKKLSADDVEAWKIPPALSNWKNNRGYTIPLDKRLAADGRAMQEHTVNDNFAKLSESLYLAERNAREAVEKRAEIARHVQTKQMQEHEQRLRELAAEARAQRSWSTSEKPLAPGEDVGDRDSRQDRDRIREERRREREREYRLEKAGKRARRDGDRDVSERVALGQAAGPKSADSLYDQRLFNQDAGIDDGFGRDGDYAEYDKPLFADTSSVYRPNAGSDTANLDVEGLRKGKVAFKKDDPSSSSGRRGRADRHHDDAADDDDISDPFGLDEFLADAKRGASRKR